MVLTISKEKKITELQMEFSRQYAFLKLEFYKVHDSNPYFLVRKHLPYEVLLKTAGLKKEGTIEVRDEMSLAELENIFLAKFGLDMQVSRKSGIVWLETTMTDNWTLEKQNEHGREISAVPQNVQLNESDNENS